MPGFLCCLLHLLPIAIHCTGGRTRVVSHWPSKANGLHFLGDSNQRSNDRGGRRVNETSA